MPLDGTKVFYQVLALFSELHTFCFSLSLQTFGCFSHPWTPVSEGWPLGTRLSWTSENWTNLPGEPGRGTERTPGCGEHTAIDSPGKIVPGLLVLLGQGPVVKGACSILYLLELWGPKTMAELELGSGTWGLLGVSSEIWVLYLLFHMGSWKGKPIPAQHCCLTWLIRSYNPAVEILGLTQNNRDQEYCG